MLKDFSNYIMLKIDMSKLETLPILLAFVAGNNCYRFPWTCCSSLSLDEKSKELLCTEWHLQYDDTVTC